jgi:large repetitive protein
MFPETKLTRLIFVCFFLFSISPSSRAAVLGSEPPSSFTNIASDDVFTISAAGTHTVSGNVGPTGGSASQAQDQFQIVIPAGFEITSATFSHSITSPSFNLVGCGLSGTSTLAQTFSPAQTSCTLQYAISTNFATSALNWSVGVVIQAVVANAAPVNTVLPAISGTAKVGNNLSASTGTWTDANSDTPTYSYQWKRGSTNVGTNSNSYALTSADAHANMKVVVTANDGNGGLTSATSAIKAVTNTTPVNTVLPAISGTAKVGNNLSATTGTWTDADGDTPTYSYQWKRGGSNVGTNSSSYALTSADAHASITVVVTANDGNGGTPSATSASKAVTNTAPVNSVLPVISGTAAVGNNLSASTGTWTDADGDTPSYSYQWKRSGTNVGTNSNSYALTAADSHANITVVVTANDGNGGTPSATSAIKAVTNAIPVNTVLPAISGTAAVGNNLSASTGTWTDGDGDTPTYSYQWKRGGTNVGTNSNSYALTAADAHANMTVVVTANDGNGGTPSATSAITAIANAIPVNTVLPVISGTAAVGNNLSASTGTWTDNDGDTPTYSYQWKRGGTNVGTNSNSYALTAADAHVNMTVVVTANDGNGGTPSATSAITAITNAIPVNTVLPVISGTAAVGNNLSASTGTWTDADGDTPTYSYQWKRGGTNVGTNSNSYALTAADAHANITVVVTANDGNGGTPSATSAITAVTNAIPVNTVLPAISGTASVGNNLSTTTGTWTDADGDTPTFSYQWKRGGTNVGTNSNSYALTAADAHANITVVVTANDGNGGTPSATSAITTIVNTAPVNTGLPVISGTAAVGNNLSVSTGTWTDADSDTPTYSYQWKRGGTNVGANTNIYSLTVTDAHANITVVVTANDGNGGTLSATSVITIVINTAPVNTVLPVVSGTAVVGGNLSASTGTWTDADADTPTYSYQWKRGGTNVGTNANSYSLTVTDAHADITVVVTANDGNGGITNATSLIKMVTNKAPVNTLLPTISGTPNVGNSLSASTGNWTDADGDTPTFSYQWKSGSTNIGTNANGYTLTAAEAHSNITVVVTANDGNGGATGATSAMTAVANTAPVNSVLPLIGGVVSVGNVITVSTGSWTDVDGDTLTYSYQWKRSGTNVGGNVANYTLTLDDAHSSISVVVTAGDGNGGTTSATSASIMIANSAPANTKLPGLFGRMSVGSILVVGTGSWVDVDGDTPTYSYQWKRSGTDIGTNTNRYTLTAADAHSDIAVIITANDGMGGSTKASTMARTVSNSVPVNTSPPVISGIAAVGQTLTTTIGAWLDADGDTLTFSYHWMADGVDIGDAVTVQSHSFTLTTAVAGKAISVVVLAKDGNGGVGGGWVRSCQW